MVLIKIHVFDRKKSFRFASNALRNEDDKNDPRVAILRHQSLISLPTCLFIVAELDPLRDDSYSRRKTMNRIEIK